VRPLLLFLLRQNVADGQEHAVVSSGLIADSGFMVVIFGARCPTCKREAHDGDLVAVNMIAGDPMSPFIAAKLIIIPPPPFPSAAIAAIIDPLLPPTHPDQPRKRVRAQPEALHEQQALPLPPSYLFHLNTLNAIKVRRVRFDV
jgi:hypothetical protein